MDTSKSKMATIVKPAEQNLISLVQWEYLCQDSYLDTSNSKICPLVMILSIVVEYLFQYNFCTSEETH